MTILSKPRRNNGGTTNLIVRGLEQPGRGLRPGFRIIEGRDLRPGVNELITSRQMGTRFENLGIGEKLDITLPQSAASDAAVWMVGATQRQDKANTEVPAPHHRTATPGQVTPDRARAS